MITRPLFPPDPERVALAVDAMCVGSPIPILIHSEHESRADPSVDPFGLFCTPLAALESIGAAIEILSRVTVPRGWRLAGLCAPTAIRVPSTRRRDTVHLDAWVVHVVSDTGAAASRLCIPDALEMSGPTTMIADDHPLHRCLGRLLRPVHDGDDRRRSPHDGTKGSVGADQRGPL